MSIFVWPPAIWQMLECLILFYVFVLFCFLVLIVVGFKFHFGGHLSKLIVVATIQEVFITMLEGIDQPLEEAARSNVNFTLSTESCLALNALRQVRFFLLHLPPKAPNLLRPLLLLQRHPKYFNKHLPVPQSCTIDKGLDGILVYPGQAGLLSYSCRSKIFKLPVCSFTVLDILDQVFFLQCSSFMGELATPRLLHVCCHLALVTNPYENTSQVGYDHG